MRVPLKNLVAGLLASLAMAVSNAHAEFSGAVHEVLNPQAPRAEWRRVPLPSAYVFISWTVVIPAPGHASSYCSHSEIARTDQNGKYVMAGPIFITAAFFDKSFRIYAPGREWVNYPYPGSRFSEKDITVEKSTASPPERMYRLLELSNPGCPGLDRKLHDPQGVLTPFHQSLVDEAKSLNVDSQPAHNILRGLEAALKMRQSGSSSPDGPMRVVPAPSKTDELIKKDTTTTVPQLHN